MVSGFLGICPKCPTPAHSFLEFLRYYAQDFDGATMFLDRGEIVVRFPGELMCGGNLWVVDPFRVGVNAAMNMTRFTEIKAVFEEVFDKFIRVIKDCRVKMTLDELLGA